MKIASGRWLDAQSKRESRKVAVPFPEFDEAPEEEALVRLPSGRVLKIPKRPSADLMEVLGGVEGRDLGPELLIKGSAGGQSAEFVEPDFQSIVLEPGGSLNQIAFDEGYRGAELVERTQQLMQFNQIGADEARRLQPGREIRLPAPSLEVMPETQDAYRQSDAGYRRELERRALVAAEEIGSPVRAGIRVNVRMYPVFGSEFSDRRPNHAFVEIEDLATGEIWIARGGPNGRGPDFLGRAVTGRLNVDTDLTREEWSEDTRRIQDDQKQVRTIRSLELPDVTMDEALRLIGEDFTDIEDGRSPYGIDRNSNDVARRAYETVTGQNWEFDPEENLWGVETPLRVPLTAPPGPYVIPDWE